MKLIAFAVISSSVFSVAISPENDTQAVHKTDENGRDTITPTPELGDEASANAQLARPDPSQVYFRGITYGGSGCPQGSVGVSFSGDRTTFTAIFDSFVASSVRNHYVTIPNALFRDSAFLLLNSERTVKSIWPCNILKAGNTRLHP
jgi:hypothetical protein